MLISIQSTFLCLGNPIFLHIENKSFLVFHINVTTIPALACKSSAYHTFSSFYDDQSTSLRKHSLLEDFKRPTISCAIVDIIDFEFIMREVTNNLLSMLFSRYDCRNTMHIVELDRFSLTDFLQNLKIMLKLFFKYLYLQSIANLLL